MPHKRKLDANVLAELNLILDQSIRKYATWYIDPDHELSFKKTGPLQFTPNKAYSAKTTYQIDTKTNNWQLHVLVFKPGGGTGDDSSYKLEDINTPKQYCFEEKPERVLPRSKKNIEWEALLPFGSIINDIFYENVVSLEELTIDYNTQPAQIVKLTDLGLELEHFKRISLGKGKAHKIIPCYTSQNHPETHYYTVGRHEGGKRFGDPHAIFHNPEITAIQMVGFVSYNTDSTMYKLLGAAESRNKKTE